MSARRSWFDTTRRAPTRIVPRCTVACKLDAAICEPSVAWVPVYSVDHGNRGFDRRAPATFDTHINAMDSFCLKVVLIVLAGVQYSTGVYRQFNE